MPKTGREEITMDTRNNFSREEIQAHWNDADWLLKHEIVTRRPASDWRPIEDCIPDVGECWITIELANGQKYVVKSAIDAKVIANGINRNYRLTAISDSLKNRASLSDVNRQVGRLF